MRHAWTAVGPPGELRFVSHPDPDGPSPGGSVRPGGQARRPAKDARPLRAPRRGPGHPRLGGAGGRRGAGRARPCAGPAGGEMADVRSASPRRPCSSAPSAWRTTTGALRGRHKLLGQAVAVAVVMGFGVVVRDIHLFGWQMDLGLLAVPFTAFLLLGAINSLNLLDGMDGLLGSVGAVISPGAGRHGRPGGPLGGRRPGRRAGRGAARLPALQPAARVDLHGRLRQHARRPGRGRAGHRRARSRGRPPSPCRPRWSC